jgi:phytoene desaturase
VFKPGRSLSEFLHPDFLKGVFKLDVFNSHAAHVRKFFKHPEIIKVLEFPVLFLGAKPSKTPALYSLMNYADIALGTWYPMGGMFKIVEAMVKIAREKGVEFRFNHEVTGFEIKNKAITAVKAGGHNIPCSGVIGGADYQHLDQAVTPEKMRNYSASYWNKRTLAPSSLIFYLGVSKRIPGLLHHNLFFDEDFEQHAKQIYDIPSWPDKPLFYACAPSVTDASVAPAGHENIFILIPVAPGIHDTDAMREKYYNLVMERLEKFTGTEIRSHVIYKRAYAHNDFISDYHAFKGNAYGLANTLSQTAILKPSLKSKKISNLYFTGQLTVPGPGVPPSIISGEVVAKEYLKDQQPTLSKKP